MSYRVVSPLCLCALVQVMPSGSAPSTATATHGEVQKHKDSTLAGLRRLLSKDALVEVPGGTGVKRRKRDNKTERTSNLLHLKSFDWALQKMNGWGLAVFLLPSSVHWQTCWCHKVFRGVTLSHYKARASSIMPAAQRWHSHV